MTRPRRISYRVFIRRLLAPSVVWILALFVKILLCSKAVENRARGWLPEGDILPEGNSTPEIESQLQRAAHSHVEDAGPPEPQPDHETTPQAARPKVATSTIETMPVQVQHLSSGLSHPLPDQVVPPQAVALKEMIGTTEAMPVQVQHLSSSLPDSSPARDLSQQASQDVTSASVKTQQQRPAQAKTRRNRTKVPFKAAEGDAPPNSLQFATSGITVAVRITRTGNSAQLARYDVAGNAIVSGPFDDSEGDRREFHHVFPAETDNNTLNRALHPLYHHFMSAPDSMSAILMDGYSGTGKSHTLCDQQDSIVMQLAAFLFPVSDTAREEPVRLAALQVVPGNGKEELDFLDLGATSAERATQTRGVPWSMSKQYVARDRQALTALLRAAKARRKRESTMNNGQSSRSHMLFAFTIEFPGDRYSTLLLADLAGNERHEGDEWDAERKKEGRGINVSRSSIEHNLKEVQKDHSHVLSSSKVRIATASRTRR